MIVCPLLQQTKTDGQTILTNKQKQYLKCFPTLWQTNKNIMFRTFFIKKKIFEATCQTRDINVMLSYSETGKSILTTMGQTQFPQSGLRLWRNEADILENICWLSFAHTSKHRSFVSPRHQNKCLKIHAIYLMISCLLVAVFK